MALTLAELRGATAEHVEKLHNAGVTDSDSLLEALSTPEGRRAMAQKLGVDGKLLLELANRADLARVKGIGTVYSDLLENAGVDTVAELAQRVPANLHSKLLEIAPTSDVIRPPQLSDVEDWVSQAKALPRKLTY